MLTALTPSKAWSERHGHHHRTVTEWARLMLLAIHRWLPGRPIVAVMDGEFAALELLHGLRARLAVITRLRKDACLFDPPPCHDGKPGRAPRKGKRQPQLSQRIIDPATRWQRVVQASRTSWRGGGWIEYAHGTALWCHGGKPIVPILWVLVRSPTGGANRRLSCARTQGPTRATCWTASTVDGPWRPRTRKPVLTSVWRHSANGPTPPCSGPPRCCSASTAWSRCMCTRMPSALPSRHAGPPGIRSQLRPLPMPWPGCVGTSGLSVSSCRLKPPM